MGGSKKRFLVRVLDLSPENLGKEKFGIRVEDGSIVNFLELDKPVIYFGTTIAGAREILGLERLCFKGT